MVVAGVDCSNWQGRINWESVARSGITFALIKASEGITYRDPYFPANWANCLARGIVRGAYHFARPSRHGPEEEARYLLDTITAAGGFCPGDLLALDLEDTDVTPPTKDLLDWTIQFCLVVQGQTAVAPLIYSGWWYLEPHGIYQRDGRADPTVYPLWLAQWQNPAAWPAPVGGWPAVTVHQYTASGVVPGIVGPCDRDQYQGTVEQLRALGFPSAEPTEAELRAALDRLWHAAGLLDNISGHDLADQMRSDTVLVKEALGLNDSNKG